MNPEQPDQTQSLAIEAWLSGEGDEGLEDLLQAAQEDPALRQMLAEQRALSRLLADHPSTAQDTADRVKDRLRRARHSKRMAMARKVTRRLAPPPRWRAPPS